MRRIIPTFDEDFPTLLLVTAIVLIPAGAMAAANWANGITILFVIGVAAVGLGYLLAVAQLSDAFVMVSSLVYGLFVTWLVGGQLDPVRLGWRDRQIDILLRVGQWLQQAASGGFSRDNVMFVLLMTFIFWCLGVNAALNIFRARHLWFASIPPGLALLINTYYYYGAARLDLYLIAYLLAVFTLAVRTNTLLRERLWRQARVGYSPSVRGDLLRGGMLGTLILIVIAWSAPTASASDRLASAWDRSINPWNRVQDTFHRLFSGLEGGTATTADYYGGATLSLGGPVNLTDALVMYVYAPPGYHYYWRSKLFDYYDGRRWLTLDDERKDSDYGVLPAEDDTTYALRTNVQQQFQMAIPVTRLIYAAAQPIAFATLPLTYDEIYTLPPSTTFGTVTAVRSKNAFVGGRSYSVTSSLSLADETSLRNAGTDYPAWVTSRYLQLPAEITPRTRDLAASTTAPYTNPYDKARAIESYLRKNIQYDITIAAPPGNVEPVDYFLFTSRKGYCNYYASAMVIMLRSLGIPARVAAGFAQGDFDTQLKAYRVQELNAHTWVEAFFPTYGWIEFEPTTALAPIVRPEKLANANRAGIGPGGDGGPDAAPTQDLERKEARLAPINASSQDSGLLSGLVIAPLVGWLLALFLLGALSAGGLWFWLEMRGMGHLSEVSRSYAKMNLLASLAGLRLEAGVTPAERGEQIAALVPKGHNLVRRITTLYVQEQYASPGSKPGPGDRRGEVARTDWLLLRPMLVQEVLNNLMSRLRPRRS